MKIAGRALEKEILTKALQSKQAELIAVYGRRRIGKTYLIRQFFARKGLFFEIMGQKDGALREQIGNFYSNLLKCFPDPIKPKEPKNWKEAFSTLTHYLDRQPKTKKIILFFDEVPWLATRRSGFLQALDYYWNKEWVKRRNIKLIVCGSAASWMLDNIVQGKGGLHNRITYKIPLQPFTLTETKEFLKMRKVSLNEKQILEIYMAFGGVPFYLSKVQAGQSAAQIIHQNCFRPKGALFAEYENLFASLFEHYEVHEKIVHHLAEARYGLSREELLKKVGFASGGTFNKRIEELEVSGFVQSFVPFGKSRKNQYVRLVDEYTYFYKKWIEPIRHKPLTGRSGNYWLSRSKTSEWSIWAGYSFESVCLKHVHLIVRALGLGELIQEVSQWRFVPPAKSKESGAQIDLLIDRTDHCISLIEIKYSKHIFAIDKEYSSQLKRKMEVFEKKTKTKKQIFLNFVTAFGLKRNTWSEDLVGEDLSLEILFRK